VAPQSENTGGSRLDPGHRLATETSTAELGRKPREILSATILILLALLIGNLGVIAYLSRERTIYFWNYAQYWTICRFWSVVLKGSLLDAAKTLWRSIRTDDYNLLPAVPIGTWMTLAGGSRMAYLLAIVNFYVAGVLVALRMLTRCFLGERERRIGCWGDLVSAAWVLLVPAVWVPILRGFLDIGGVAIACFTLWLYFRSADRPLSLRASFLIGVLLACLYLFRRWYAFWVISFLASAGLDFAGILWRNRLANGPKLGKAVRTALPLIVMSTTMVSLLMVLAWPLLYRVMTTNYSDIYSAYRSEQNLRYNILLIVIHIGGAFLLYILLGFGCLLAWPGTRRLSLFLAVQSFIIIYMFSSVQNFDFNHIYLFMPAFLLVANVFTIRLAGRLPYAWARAALLVPALAIGLVSLAASFVAPARPLLQASLGYWIPTFTCDPLVRTDLREFARMLSILDDYLQTSDGRFYVLSSSRTLCGGHFLYAEPSFSVRFRSRDRLTCEACDVDKRDGFPGPLLEADLVVVGVPIQCALRRDDQQVVVIPAESFLNRIDIGRAFEQLPEEFSLEQGVRVIFFRKVRPIAPGEIAALSERLRAVYPDRPFIYQPPRQVSRPRSG
jgi:hypothetical protein